MSGGSYNYIYYWVEEGVEELVERRKDVKAMLQRLQGLKYASNVAKETEIVLEDLNVLEQMQAQLELQLVPIKARIEARARNLAQVWQAVEWWNSHDWSEQKVKSAIAQFQRDLANDNPGWGSFVISAIADLISRCEEPETLEQKKYADGYQFALNIAAFKAHELSKEEFDMWLVEAESEPERYQSISCFDHVALAAIKDALRSLSEYLRGKE